MSQVLKTCNIRMDSNFLNACLDRIKLGKAADRTDDSYEVLHRFDLGTEGGTLAGLSLGAVSGGSIPLIFRALGRDPAHASSIFLTTITDGAGFFIFLGLASLFLL